MIMNKLAINRPNQQLTINTNSGVYIDPVEWDTIMRMGEALVKTNFLGANIKTGAQAAAIMLKGKELNVPPMQSLSSINIIQNKPTISPEMMLALIYRDIPGVKINFPILTKECCQIKTTRPGQLEQIIEFTKQDAIDAGLWGNATWKKYSRAMLRSRAIGEMARTVYPDVISGCSYTPEEMGADVDGEGNVIHISESVVKPQAEPEYEEAEEVKGITQAQRSRMLGIMRENGKTPDDIKKYMKDAFGIESSKELTPEQYAQTVDWLQDIK